MEEFCILHGYEDTQLLIDSAYDPEADEFKITLKFWCELINGFLSMGLSWGEESEDNYNACFEEMKDRDKARQWMDNIVSDITKAA
jgi:hypothetical protein